MASAPGRLSQALLGFWRSMTGRKPPLPGHQAIPGAMLHDPAAQRPHDLDDPFFDPEVQARIATAIANAKQTPKE